MTSPPEPTVTVAEVRRLWCIWRSRNLHRVSPTANDAVHDYLTELDRIITSRANRNPRR